MLALPVGHEALEPADPDGVLLRAQHAAELALMLDRAHAAADGRQDVPPPDRSRRLVEAAERDRAHEVADRDVDRATLLAHGVLTLETTAGLEDGLLDRVPERHLVPARPPLLRIGRRHLDLVGIDHRHC